MMVSIMIDDARSYCEHVIYYKSLFYAVNKKGSLAICDVNGIAPLVTLMSPVLPFSVSNADVLYLVASSAELLLVTRYLDLVHDPLVEFASYKTVGFNAFQLDVSSIPKWVEVKSLGDQMLFLGTNSSLCLLASEFSGCQGNSIYFTNDCSEANDDGIHGNHDSGVFNMGDRSIEALPYCTTGYDWSFLPPPVWLTPNPW
ncbi:hypothetical protein C5167_016978 [Papaver somniferum]|uniref:KIB1-4 beta-propeller domain-containing protein n=2 Tax=Papaver somniferum TaxID=3469 RepID=A0A4Y7IL92_PAPSO|nr:hypothetical protein C5167_016978 [Papaver somniferum]